MEESKNTEQNLKEEISFSFTEELISGFAEITGDFSSLHVDKAFGRKSFYRRTVAHGMLLVSQLLKSKLFMDNSNLSLQNISCKFFKPAFPDVIYKLIVSSENINEENKLSTFEYKVEESEMHSLICRGSFSLAESDDSNLKVQKTEIESDGIILDDLKELVKTYEEFEEGNKDEFDFLISKNHLKKFVELITGKGINFDFHSAGLLSNLLCSCLLSTFVGMKIPGRYATFLDFNLEFKERIQIGLKYKLKGEIILKSEPATALVLEMNIFKQGSEESIALGNVTAKVTQAPVVTPGIEDIKKTGYEINLKDKVVIITGASRGNGAVTAKMFGLYGAKVIVNYFQSKVEAETVVDEIIKAGGTAKAIKADVSNLDEVKAMVSQTINEFGRIDILVNNAVGDYQPKGFLELSWEDILKEINVSVRGAFNCCSQVLPFMMKNQSGKIINISTVAVENPPLKQSKYVIAKSAMNGLTRSLAVEYAAYNIQVNLVVPGLVETDLTNFLSKSVREEIKRQTPMRRLASTIDVAKSIIFLASGLSSYTTGQKIMVTGGMPPFL